MSGWLSAPRPQVVIGPLGWLRVALRAAALLAVNLCGLLLLLGLRVIERPLHGAERPWTPSITRLVCRLSLRIIGIAFSQRGSPMQGPGAMVSNHSGWLDIFALNAASRLYFVSKAEVARWPVIGWLARATGTVFIARRPAEAKLQQAIFEDRLLHGHKLMFFPEGTSSDACRVLPFKSTLFAAFLTPALREQLAIQPVSVNWHAPTGADPRFYGWWGDMGFGQHLIEVLAAPRQGRVELIYHPPLNVRDFTDRKALTAAAEAAVRQGHQITPATLPAAKAIPAPQA